MKTTKIFDNLYKHTTDKVFVKSDKTEVYGQLLYSPLEKPDIIEVSEDEANKIKEEIEKRYEYNSLQVNSK